MTDSTDGEKARDHEKRESGQGVLIAAQPNQGLSESDFGLRTLVTGGDDVKVEYAEL